MKIKLLKKCLLTFMMIVMLPFYALAVVITNTGEKAVPVIIAEGATRRDYSIDSQKQISVCLKGCFITLSNGDRYALSGEENLDVSSTRINFH